MQPLIITKKESEKILVAKNNEVEVSLDLGITKDLVAITDGFVLIKNNKIPLEEFKKIKKDSCYIIDSGHIKKLAFFSQESNFYYKLMPTAEWPTITLSSTPMHRRVFFSPREDTATKIAEISPVKGGILDTCCGLGYTAIMASRDADIVHTFEKDNYVLHIASLNPYSQELFSNKKIKIHKEDISKAIKKFENDFFDRIIHDPPTFRYADKLYSKEFYFELYRVLKNNGILYHYAPWPHKTKKQPLYPRIIKNLKECGFKKLEYHEKSSGVRGVK